MESSAIATAALAIGSGFNRGAGKRGFVGGFVFVDTAQLFSSQLFVPRAKVSPDALGVIA